MNKKRLINKISNHKMFLLTAISLLSIKGGALLAMDMTRTLSSDKHPMEAKRAVIALVTERNQQSAGQNSAARSASNPTLNPAPMPYDQSVPRALEFGMDLNRPGKKITIKKVKYGVLPYQYSCDGGQTFQESPVFENMEPREYCIYVRDSTGNHAKKIIHMDEKHIKDYSNSALHIQRIFCAPNMFVIIARGGKPPYTYSCDGGATYQNSSEFMNRAVGNYHILVTDADDTVVDSLYTLIEFQLDGQDENPLVHQQEMPVIGTKEKPVSTEKTDAAAVRTTLMLTAEREQSQLPAIQPQKEAVVNNQNISLRITAKGSTLIIEPRTGKEPFQFSIDGGQTFQKTGTFENLEPREYLLVVTDASGDRAEFLKNMDLAAEAQKLQSMDDIYIVQNKLVFAGLGVIQPEHTASGKLGSYKVNVQGGQAPYLYSCNGGKTYQSSPLLENLKQGKYHIMVKDTIGTIIEKVVTVNTI